MAITDSSWADFVVFTLPEDGDADEDAHIEHISRSESVRQKKLPAVS